MVGDLRFTIVSNNCWGAHVYQALGVTYSSPFVGLFILPDSYLRLLARFEKLIRAELKFVPESRSEKINAWRMRKGLAYPIGLLGGCVEVNFQHYVDEEEARSKWRRRVERMAEDPARYFFKFDDRDDATTDDIGAFFDLPLDNKVCFTARYRHGLATVAAPAEPGSSHVPDGLTLGRVSRKYFNTLRWISSQPSWIRLPSLI